MLRYSHWNQLRTGFQSLRKARFSCARFVRLRESMRTTASTRGIIAISVPISPNGTMEKTMESTSARTISARLSWSAP